MELKIFYEETDETKNILGKLLEDKFIKEAILADRHNRRVTLLKYCCGCGYEVFAH